MDYITRYESPLGGITLAADGAALVGLWFDGQRHFAETLDSWHEECASLPIFGEAKRWLDLYFSGRDPGFTPRLAMRTTPFRKQVWEIMLAIPYGKTMTYGEIAKRMAETRPIASPQGSARAVGGAVGHNSISLIIPCHRVVGANGALTGYAAGIDRKMQLLRMERETVPCCYP